jgi:nucleoside-diphosphate-sugar epimerase
MTMKVLIVGGTGLISSGITQQLLQCGADLTLYNRRQREAQFASERVSWLSGDRTQYAAFEAQVAAAGTFDFVIDMICFRPEEAESAVRSFRGRCAQYIWCSTVDVYAKPAAHYPVREDAEHRAAPTFPYAYAKGACERILEQAHGRGDLNVTTIRPAHTYGEGGRVLHSFRSDTYFLDRLWSSCHRDDVARAFVGAIGNPKAYGQSYHVTGEEWMTWNLYHQLVAEAMYAPPPVLVHIPSDLLGQAVPKLAEWCVENFRFNNIFDNAAARTDLGFRYTIPFLEGMKRAISWLEQRGLIQDSRDFPFYDRIISAWQRLGIEMSRELANLN